MDKIHVLVIPTWYPNGVDKLMGQYHKQFCNALACDERMKANMLYVDRQGISQIKSYIGMKKNFVDDYDNYKVYGKKMLDISKISCDLQIKSYANTLYKLYKQYEKIHGKPDIIHAQVSVPAGYACCELGKKINVPVIMTEHATYYDRYFTDWEEKYNKVVMENAFITCVGDFMIDFYEEKGVNADLLPNIVECAEFDIPHNEAIGERFNIVSVGALREIKRYENTIEAVKRLKDKIPYIHFTIVGDGECEDYLKDYTKKANMEKYVTFVGRKTHKEIAHIFKDMDTLVVSSDFETFGIPAVEALAAGLPVISTKNYGTEMFLNKDTGYFCTVNDIDDLTNAIDKMHATKDDFSKEKLKAIAKKYDSANVANMAYNYYIEIINK